MKVIVTGAAGFIGSRLTELLLKKGHHVKGIDILEKTLAPFKNASKFSYINVDIRHLDALKPFFDEVDWVFHLAALTDIVSSVKSPLEYFEVNVKGTLNVLECAKKANIKRFIYAASASCYGDPKIFPTPETAPLSPKNPYALTKSLGEQLIMHWEKVYALPAISLRLFNVFGAQMSIHGTYANVFINFLNQKQNNKPLTIVGDGSQTRDFIFVSDVAQAFCLAAESSVSGEIFNVGSGREHSIKELASFFQGKTIHVPMRKEEALRSCADISKVKKTLGFSPKVSFKEGLHHLLRECS